MVSGVGLGRTGVEVAGALEVELRERAQGRGGETRNSPSFISYSTQARSSSDSSGMSVSRRTKSAVGMLVTCKRLFHSRWSSRGSNGFASGVGDGDELPVPLLLPSPSPLPSLLPSPSPLPFSSPVPSEAGDGGRLVMVMALPLAWCKMA